MLACFVGVSALAGHAWAQTAATPDGRGPEARRGPLDIRDEHLLTQPRLTLPAVSPHTVPQGTWTLDVSVLVSNSFSWTQDIPGENPGQRLFLIDGEALSLAVAARRGLGPDLDVGVRVPLRHRSGGILDGFIDAWHRALNIEDASRPSFLRDAYRIEGTTTDGMEFSWSADEGTGLGNIETDIRWRAVDGGPDHASVALVGRLSLPSGAGPFDEHGLGAGVQIVADVPLGRTFDLYLGAGATVQEAGPVQRVRYRHTRAHGFAAFEWRPWKRVSLLVETNAASRLVTNISAYPGLHWLVSVEGRVDLGETLRLDLGLTENLIDQQGTTDLAFFFGFGWRPGRAATTIPGHGQDH
jgi:hypothetical protein